MAVEDMPPPPRGGRGPLPRVTERADPGQHAGDEAALVRRERCEPAGEGACATASAVHRARLPAPVSRLPAPAGGWQLAEWTASSASRTRTGRGLPGLETSALDTVARRGLMSLMRNRFLVALPTLLLALATRAGAAQAALQIRWELVGDSIANGHGASRAAFTLTNRRTQALAPTRS